MAGEFTLPHNLRRWRRPNDGDSMYDSNAWRSDNSLEQWLKTVLCYKGGYVSIVCQDIDMQQIPPKWFIIAWPSIDEAGRARISKSTYGELSLTQLHQARWRT